MKPIQIVLLLLVCYHMTSGKFIIEKFEDSFNQLLNPFDEKSEVGDQQCEEDAFPPPDSDKIPTYIINLDDPPHIRWNKLITDKIIPLRKLVNYVQTFAIELFGEKIFNFVNNSLPEVTKSLPSPYKEEIYGIAEAGGLTVTQATLYNIFYEVFSFCTSIVAEDSNGKLYHARNLDFGLLMGWDRRNNTWLVAEMLRPLVIHVKWTRGGHEIFESVSYAGFVGILTAVKKDHFTFSLDERFKLNGGYVGLLEWIIWRDYDQKWVSFLARDVMENSTGYQHAVDQLTTQRLLAPVYFIIAGNQSGQASIITRGRSDADILHLKSSHSGQASWFLVETNYDHWESPPFYDNRRQTAVQCLSKVTQQSLSHKALYNVLSSQPVLNKLTTYTSLMDVEKGFIGTWLRSCKDPCYPW